MIAQRPRIVQRIVRHLAVGSGTKAGQRCEMEHQPRHLGHHSGPGHEKRIEQGNVLRPVGDDQRAGIPGEIVGDRPGRICSAHPWGKKAMRDRIEIGDDVALDPILERSIPAERQVKLFSLVRHQCEAEKRAAPSIIFGI